jgi:hypothetical protein
MMVTAKLRPVVSRGLLRGRSAEEGGKQKAERGKRKKIGSAQWAVGHKGTQDGMSLGQEGWLAPAA